MQFIYPYTVEQDEHGFWQVRFPDVPEALTEGETEDEAHHLALDALIAALGGIVKLKDRTLPRPSPVGEGQYPAIVPMLQAAKLALCVAMRKQGMSNIALGRAMGKAEGEVRRWLDLDHETKIGTIEQALYLLGVSVSAETHNSQPPLAA